MNALWATELESVSNGSELHITRDVETPEEQTANDVAEKKFIQACSKVLFYKSTLNIRVHYAD